MSSLNDGTDTAERIRSMRAAGHRLDAIAAAVNLKPWQVEQRYRQALREGARLFVENLRETPASRAAGDSTETRAVLRDLERALALATTPALPGGRGNGR